MSVAPFRWAENDTELWVTIEVQDAKDRVVTLAEDSFHFVCPSLNYDFTIPLFKKINVEESSFAVKDPGVELRLIKQDEGRWEKITTEQAKFKRWIKIDWDLFNDPDDEEDVVKNPGADFGQGGMDFSQLLGGMGGMGGGMEGMGGPGGMDFASMMGGMGGQGGPGGMDLASMMGGMGGQGGQGGMDFASMMAGMGGQGGEGGMPDMAAMQEMLASMQQQQGGHDHHHEHGEHCDHGHDHAQEQGQEQGEEAGDNTAAVVDEVE